MQPRFEQFIKEKQYLENVSRTTVELYRRALRFLPSDAPTQDQLQEMVLGMRQKGLKETGCNIIIRTVNAYLHWASGREGRCGPGCDHRKLKRLKEPKTIMPTFTQGQIETLVRSRPRTRAEKRTHLLVLFLLDTGCRISEVLTLRVGEIDFDNLLVTLDGKGRKQRVVPYSVELRRALYRHIQDHHLTPHDLLFSTASGLEWSRRNVLRLVKQLCRDLGFEPPARTLHSFRHTFAVNYLRRGGSTFHLQRSLGHSTLEMTRRYANLNTEDLQAVHPRISLLKQDWRRNA